MVFEKGERNRLVTCEETITVAFCDEKAAYSAGTSLKSKRVSDITNMWLLRSDTSLRRLCGLISIPLPT